MEVNKDAEPVRVLVADDQEIVRVGLIATLAKQPGIKIVAEASDGQQALELCKQEQPDVVLMDLAMPRMDGIEATRRVKEYAPDMRVIILTGYERDDDVFAALGAGADGYCMKTIGPEQLAAAIKTVAQGAGWLDSAVAQRVLSASAHGRKSEDFVEKRGVPSEKMAGNLSEREIEVLALLVEGLSNQEMAKRLVVSVETIKTHLRHIFEKLMVTDRTQAAVKALRQGLLKNNQA